MSNSAVIFDAHVNVPDRNPEVLETKASFSNKVNRFRTTAYVAMREYRRPGWTWQRVGLILNNDGEPRKDKRTESVRVAFDQVPPYVLRAVAKEIELRAVEAKRQIDEWVQAARDLVTQVEVEEPA